MPKITKTEVVEESGHYFLMKCECGCEFTADAVTSEGMWFDPVARTNVAVCPRCNAETKTCEITPTFPIFQYAELPDFLFHECEAEACAGRATRVAFTMNVDKSMHILCAEHFSAFVEQEKERWRVAMDQFGARVRESLAKMDFAAIEMLVMQSLRQGGKNRQFAQAFGGSPTGRTSMPNFQNIGTQTGRMQCKEPNLSNTPKKAGGALDLEPCCDEYDPGGTGTIMKDGHPQCANCGYMRTEHTVSDGDPHPCPVGDPTHPDGGSMK